MRNDPPDPFNLGMSRFVPGLFGFVFGGSGVTLLGYLWLWPSDEFGSPPMFFRIFASFIGIAFVGFGAAAVWTAINGGPTPRSLLANLQDLSRASNTPGNLGRASSHPSPVASPGSANYACPHCAAPLQSQAEVSPLGDVKCPFCNAWFNIHQHQRS